MSESKQLKHARHYGKMGLRVFPCVVNGKKPVTAHGSLDATTDAAQIEEWWSTYPYNVAIATGNGIVVLDVDVDHDAGKYGDETLKGLEAAHGPLPDTWTCLTGGGGLHYYFACDDKSLTVGTSIAPGLDYRGAGGYVIAPGSVHSSGREYLWEVEHTPINCQLAPLPDWLHQLMLAARKPTTHSATKNTTPDTWSEGQRNDGLFRLACSLRAKGLTEEGISAALMTENEARCNPPLSRSEVETICKSAGRYEQGEVKTGNRPRPTLVCASDVPYEPPRWLIPPYIQRGRGTLIQGDPGTGKTAFVCAIAAHVSTGSPLLGIPIAMPGDVVVLSVEDDLPVLRGRIEADGGDLTRCHFLTNAAGLTFTSPEVENAIKEVSAKLVVFDPLQAFLGAKIDMFRSNETRPELAKLFEMCERNDCGCVIIVHTGKNTGDKSVVNRSLGSVDIPAAMRSVMQLIRNPDNEDECVMVQVKCSNAPRGRSIAYTIGDRGGVEWIGFSPLTVDDLATVTKRKEKGIPYENEPLVQVFNQLITDRPGGGFWSYNDLKRRGSDILGFMPFDDVGDLRKRLDSGLARELMAKDGIMVTHSERGRGNARGIRIEQYRAPRGYQTKIGG